MYSCLHLYIRFLVGIIMEWHTFSSLSLNSFDTEETSLILSLVSPELFLDEKQWRTC